MHLLIQPWIYLKSSQSHLFIDTYLVHNMGVGSVVGIGVGMGNGMGVGMVMEWVLELALERVLELVLEWVLELVLDIIFQYTGTSHSIFKINPYISLPLFSRFLVVVVVSMVDRIVGMIVVRLLYSGVSLKFSMIFIK